MVIGAWCRLRRMAIRSDVDVVSDGELRRYAFFGHLVDAVDGFDKLGGWAIPFRDEQGRELVFRRPVVVEKLRWRRSMCAEELTYLRAREAPGDGSTTPRNTCRSSGSRWARSAASPRPSKAT
jgi:methionine synthase II (cobalamin-independent)